MVPTFCIGIDISKVTLDIAVLKDGVLLLTRKIDNSEAAVKQFLAGLKSEHKSTADNTICCAENMGIYGKFLSDVLSKKEFRLCLENPLHLKLSLGIQRSKSDLQDAIRIAEYAYKNAGSLKFWTPPRPPLQQLKTLMTLRKKMIKMSVMLKNTTKLEAYYLSAESRKDIGAFSASTVKSIKNDIQLIEREMINVVNLDPVLHNLIQVVTSIPHVGKITALEMIITTNEFKEITSPKKFCSYCGIAPFAKSSGTTLKRKPRISNIANKDMKAVLHMAAVSSLKHKKSTLHVYYVRKVAEGKNKMSVLNAIRNKLVTVIFACVRDNKLYQEPYSTLQQP